MIIDFGSLDAKERELLVIAYNGLVSFMVVHASSNNNELAMDTLTNAIEGIMQLATPTEAIALNTKLMRILEFAGNKDFVYGEINCTKLEETTFTDVVEVAKLNALHKL